MSTHFNSLNIDCVVLIFTRLPLDDLLRTHQVCHHWATIQSISCRSKHRLTLVDSRDVYTQHFHELYRTFGFGNFDLRFLLKVDHLSEDVCEKLVCKFPNVGQLEILQTNLSEIVGELEILLQGSWCDKLMNLKVIITDFSIPCRHLESRYWPQVFELIDQLPNLESLTMFDELKLPFPNVESFPNLSNLTEFNYGLDLDHLNDVFEQLNDCTKLKKLSILTQGRPSRDIGGLDVSVASKLTHLTVISRDFLIPDSLFEMSQCFTALTHLHIQVKFNFNLQLRILAQFKNLRSLRMSYRPEFFGNFSSNVKLPNIRTLKLDCDLFISKVTKSVLELLSISSHPIRILFPNLKKLKFFNSYTHKYPLVSDKVLQFPSVPVKISV